MYCVMGDQILRCEIMERQEAFAWCKIGKATKNKSIPYTKLFETEEEAKKYIARKQEYKRTEGIKIDEHVKKCVSLYQSLEQDTGIKVRTIDRRWTVSEAEKHVSKLRKSYQKNQAKQETQKS